MNCSFIIFSPVRSRQQRCDCGHAWQRSLKETYYASKHGEGRKKVSTVSAISSVILLDLLTFDKSVIIKVCEAKFSLVIFFLFCARTVKIGTIVVCTFHFYTTSTTYSGSMWDVLFIHQFKSVKKYLVYRYPISLQS